MNQITSIKDPFFQKLRRSRSEKGRKENDAYLLEESSLLKTAIDTNIEIEGVIYHSSPPPFEELLKSKKIPYYKVSQGIFKKLFPTGKLPEITALVKKEEHDLYTLNNEKIILVLDNVLHSGNVGTIIRTASAFGIHAIVLIGETELYARNVIKGAKEGFFKTKMALSSLEELIPFLEMYHYQITTTSSHSEHSLTEIPKDSPLAIVIGNEGEGVSSSWSTTKTTQVTIPQYSNVESLNASVAAGIILYELTRGSIANE